MKELREISPLLASLEKVNVFRVPDGYFDNLEFSITDYVMLGISTVKGIDKKNLHDVPGGYFDSLSDSIMAKIRVAYPESFNDEQLPGVLIGLKNTNPFSVPAGYFDSVSDAIVAKIASGENAAEELQQLSLLLYRLKDINVFAVPENYFETISDAVIENLSDETAEQEIRRLSPLLYSLQNENVFTVPYGYFSSLGNDIVEKVKPAPARIIRMHSSRRSWLKYAVAAAITGIIAFGSIKLFNSQHTGMPPIAANLSQAIRESKQYKTETDIDNAVAKLDDADIARYLEKNGSIADNDLLINNTDESDLPDPNDYLISDSTLSNYLEKINANTNKLTP